MNRAELYLSGKLAGRHAAGNLRQLPATPPLLDFCSNDYLGLATFGHADTYGGQRYSNGATGSRLISGNDSYTEEVERYIAAFHKAEAALIFNSGYDANIGLISSVAGRDTVFLYDELCHASLIDGMRLALCRHRQKFAHNDTVALESLLQKHRDAGQLLVIVESVYSMDGDWAPLTDIVLLCERYGAQLIVDEAHATGVIGPHGEGLVCTYGLQQRIFARVHTFGKALGCHGAAVVGSALLRQYLVNFARSFVYTTALPPHAVHAAHSAYLFLNSPGFDADILHDRISYFKKQAQAAGIAGLQPGRSTIHAVLTEGNERTRRMATALQQAGLWVHPILSPTVPAGRERLRICIHSFNMNDEIDLLVNTLKNEQER